MATQVQVYERYGTVAEAAQWFEHELGDLLFTAKGLEAGLDHTPNPELTSKLFDETSRDTVGSLLGKIGRHFGIQQDVTAHFRAAHMARNMLVHGFWVFHVENMKTEAGRKEILAMLDNFDGTLRDARRDVRLMTDRAIVALRGKSKPH